MYLLKIYLQKIHLDTVTFTFFDVIGCSIEVLLKNGIEIFNACEEVRMFHKV